VFPCWLAGVVRFHTKPLTAYDTLRWGPRGRGPAALIGGSAPQFGCWNATLLDTVQVVAIQPWSLWFRSNAPPAPEPGLTP